MPRRLAIIAIMALSSSALGQTAPPVEIVARAIGDMPSLALVQFVARHSVAFSVTEAEHPTFKDLTASEIATNLCGANEDGYLQAFATLNNLPSAPPDWKPGAQAYSYTWPACLKVRRDVTFRVRRGDGLASIRLALTGSFVVDDKLDAYFAGTGLTRKSTIPVGTDLKLPYGTIETSLVSKDLSLDAYLAGFADAAKTKNGARPAAGGFGVLINAVFEPVATPSNSAGRLAGTSVDCVSDENEDDPWPYNALEVANAFKFDGVKPPSLNTVTVVIVDNGFFGVPCSAAGCPPVGGDPDIAFSKRFPKRFFLPGSGYRGYGTTFGPSTSLSPLNYDDTRSIPVTEISGHGTHVAGLALGGPAFEPFRRYLDDGSGLSARLRLSILALTRGTDQLPDKSDGGVAPGIESVTEPSIVNMSIAFDGHTATKAQKYMRDLLGDLSGTLFISAAGNAFPGGSPVSLDQSPYFPAALGGPDSDNLITVASLDADGRISTFSNRGGKVDIAAPGCRVLSWLDGDNDPVPLSGTSQASPLVSFAAALLRMRWSSADGGTPRHIKNRLVYAGDLIAAPSRQLVPNATRLNMQKSLFLGFDYVEIAIAGKRRKLLGTISPFSGVTCTGSDVPFADIRSVKRAEAGVYSFTVPTGDDGPIANCPGALRETVTGGIQNQIRFVPEWEIIGASIAQYQAQPGDPTPFAFPAASLVEYVSRAIRPN